CPSQPTLLTNSRSFLPLRVPLTSRGTLISMRHCCLRCYCARGGCFFRGVISACGATKPCAVVPPSSELSDSPSETRLRGCRTGRVLSAQFETHWFLGCHQKRAMPYCFSI